jgi:hypothetical protein
MASGPTQYERDVLAEACKASAAAKRANVVSTTAMIVAIAAMAISFGQYYESRRANDENAINRAALVYVELVGDEGGGPRFYVRNRNLFPVQDVSVSLLDTEGRVIDQVLALGDIPPCSSIPIVLPITVASASPGDLYFTETGRSWRRTLNEKVERVGDSNVDASRTSNGTVLPISSGC